jgi:S-sulfo-L-cysteine synthase (3-phospho-L-serine-dependent)
LPSVVAEQLIIPGFDKNPLEHLPTLISFAQRQRATGLVTFEDDLALATALAARRLNLTGPDPESVRRSAGKSACRAALADRGLSTVAYLEVNAKDGDVAIGSTPIDFPVVVKPGGLSGSHGVFLVNSNAELKTAIRSAYELSLDASLEKGTIVIEEYIEGKNATVEIAAFDGSYSLIGTSETEYDFQQIGSLQRFRLRAVNVPGQLQDSERDVLYNAAVRAVEACGLMDTVVHVELRLSSTGPHIIELNPRAAGAFLPEMIELCYGVPYTEIALAIASGEQMPALRKPQYKAAAVRFFSIPNQLLGRDKVQITNVVDPRRYLDSENFYRMQIRVQRGMYSFYNQMSSVGYVFTVGNNSSEANNAAEQAMALFHFDYVL